MNFLEKIFTKLNSNNKTWKVSAVRMNSNIKDFNEAMNNYDDIMLNVQVSNDEHGVLMTIWDEKTEYSFLIDKQMLKFMNKNRQ